MRPFIGRSCTNGRLYTILYRMKLSLCKLKKLCLAQFVLLLICGSLSGEPLFRFHAITDVLPSLSISSIAQDSRGFLWYGTQGGLVMYNGNDYSIYSSIPFAENTLSSNLIQTMMMDEKDILWVGTYAGLDRYDIATGLFKNYSIGNDVVVSIYRDSRGRLWAGTLAGLGCLEKDSEVFVLYTKENPDRFIADNTVRNVYEDSRGIIYASTYNGLQQYNPDTDSFVPSTLLLEGNPASSGVIYGVKEDNDGNYWVVRWGTGLIRIDGKTREYTVFPLKDNRTYNINTDFDPDLVLVGTWGGGLNVFDKQSGEIIDYTMHSPPGKRLSNDIVYSQFVDNTGLLWLGTNGGGLNVYDSQHSWFSSVNAVGEGEVGLPVGKINALMEGPDGEIWVSVVGKGITRYNPRTETFIQHRAEQGRAGSLISDTVYCFAWGPENTVYVGTDKGLVQYDISRSRFTAVSWFQKFDLGPTEQNVYFISQGKDGSLWIGIFNGGIVRYFPDSGRFIRYRHDPANLSSLSDNLVYFAEADSSGQMWIGTNKGLNAFQEDSGSFTRYTYDRTNRNGISSNTVYSFYEHTDGSLWFGTRNGGLTSFNPENGTFSHVTSEQGLPSDTIVGICPSNDDKLWAATQNGLVQYDIVKKTLSIFKTSDGLISQQFNAAATTSRDGIRYFGTPLGLVYFSEKDLEGTAQRSPAIGLTSLVINNKNLRIPFGGQVKPGLRLESDQRNLTLGYAALNFSPLARYSYSYRLEGYDEQWVFAGERKYAMYTNLNPGKYLFRVRIDGLYNGEAGRETELSFEIQKPVYARWWALSLYALLALAAVYLGLRFRSSIEKVGELELTTSTLESKNIHLKQLSYQDALTGIPNRRNFEYVISREWQAALVRKDCLSVLMIDIDFFKQYNDTYGHLAGDEALKKVAQAIKSALFRVSDVCARYGGEEFVVVLPDTNTENAYAICERVMHAIAMCDIPSQTEIGSLLSVSIGCFTGIPEPGFTYDQFILKADQALYKAKKDGRNRISVTV